MAYAFLRLLFGADHFVKNVCVLLSLRSQAVNRHAENRKLTAKLKDGTEELGALKRAYSDVKAQVEAGYALELND